MKRRTFLSISALGMMGGLTRRGAAAQQARVRFCTIAYNVLAFRGYPDNEATRARLAADRPTMPERMAEALKVFNPQLITFKEGPSKELTARFAKALGMQHAWFPPGCCEDSAQYPGGFPGAVVTPYSIVEAVSRPSAGAPHPAELFTRHLGRARLVTPFGPLQVISAHFHPREHEIRMREAAAVIALIAQLRESGPVLMQGDLNHTPDTPEYKVWLDAGLVDVAAAYGLKNAPTSSSATPRQRIDYIWATPDLATQATAARVLNAPPYLLATDRPDAYALSDHLPVMAEFHMLPSGAAAK